MEVYKAVTLIDALVFRPGWTFEATDHTERFEGSVKLLITYPAAMSDEAEAPKGYPDMFTAHVSFTLPVIDCNDENDLYLRVLRIIGKIDEHERREFLRILPTYKAPFHPHRIDGMKLYGDVRGDLGFGVV